VHLMSKPRSSSCSISSRRDRSLSRRALPTITSDVIDPAGEATMLDLQERFRMADIDG
jgi:hypothetical protein